MTGHTEFYAVAAQLIPLLMIVILLEERLVADLPRILGRHILGWLMVALFGYWAFAEGAALSATYHGSESSVSRELVFLAVASQLAIAFAVPLAVQLKRKGATPADESKAK
jgi:hypothetical protein